MKWTSLLLYGLVLGLSLAALQFVQYKMIVLEHAGQWYIGIVALLFAALGIWAGNKLTRHKKTAPGAGPAERDAPLQAPEEILEKLGITPREFEVLELVAQGLSNQEIADRLFVSLNTVKTHASNVFGKLDAQRRTQAIRKAKTLGLLP